MPPKVALEIKVSFPARISKHFANHSAGRMRIEFVFDDAAAARLVLEHA
jgi:hypothetical protein